MLHKFPARYKTQLNLARSYLVADKDYKIDSVVFISRQRINCQGKNGFVYFFKYRVKKEDDWKIGLSGLQPENILEVSSNNSLSVMTDKKIKTSEPLNEQLQEQLKRLLFTFHKSARNFFDSEGNGYRFTKVTDYEER